MEVAVEDVGSLGKKLHITVPFTEIRPKLTEEIQRMSRQARLDGFRPGKVPLHVIEQRFGQQIFQDIARNVIRNSYMRAVQEHNFRPAGNPDFEDISMMPGEDIRFTARIELYPQFQIVPMVGHSIEKPISEIGEQDIRNMIERVRKNHMHWTAAERPAQEGDRLTINFGGDNKQEKDLQIILGDESTSPPAFTECLTGVCCGETRVVSLHSDKTSEKTEYKVGVKLVEEGELPQLNDEFFESCGVKEGGLDGLRKMLADGMQAQLKNSLESVTKTKVMNALLEKNQIELPQSLIAQEIEAMRSESVKRLNLTAEQVTALSDDLYRDAAKRRVKLSLLLNQFAQQRQLVAEKQAVEAKLDAMAAAYEDSESIKQYYHNDSEARFTLEAMVLEDKVIAAVLNEADVSEKYYSFDEILKEASSH